MSEARLESERLLLRPPNAQDAASYAEFQLRNQKYFERWSPARRDEYFTADWWTNALQEAEANIAGGSVLALGLYLKTDPRTLMGTCKFDQIARGVFQSCMLGYSIDERHAGHGYMTEALETAITHVFDVMRLHRIQANHLPENARSTAVLARLGFVCEGLAPQYLFIDGAWRDHVLNSLINPRFNNTWMP
jgi:ribosomal-protein-alanine N-acetyltransferase